MQPDAPDGGQMPQGMTPEMLEQFKQQMQRVVAMRLGLPSTPTPADAADALAVALCHVQHRVLNARIS